MVKRGLGMVNKALPLAPWNVQNTVVNAVLQHSDFSKPTATLESGDYARMGQQFITDKSQIPDAMVAQYVKSHPKGFPSRWTTHHFETTASEARDALWKDIFDPAKRGAIVEASDPVMTGAMGAAAAAGAGMALPAILMIGAMDAATAPAFDVITEEHPLIGLASLLLYGAVSPVAAQKAGRWLKNEDPALKEMAALLGKDPATARQKLTALMGRNDLTAKQKQLKEALTKVVKALPPPEDPRTPGLLEAMQKPAAHRTPEEAQLVQGFVSKMESTPPTEASARAMANRHTAEADMKTNAIRRQFRPGQGPEGPPPPVESLTSRFQTAPQFVLGRGPKTTPPQPQLVGQRLGVNMGAHEPVPPARAFYPSGESMGPTSGVSRLGPGPAAPPAPPNRIPTRMVPRTQWSTGGPWRSKGAGKIVTQARPTPEPIGLGSRSPLGTTGPAIDRTGTGRRLPSGESLGPVPPSPAAETQPPVPPPQGLGSAAGETGSVRPSTALHLASGGLGAAAGGTQGNTPEERLRNAAIGGLAGYALSRGLATNARLPRALRERGSIGGDESFKDYLERRSRQGFSYGGPDIPTEVPKRIPPSGKTNYGSKTHSAIMESRENDAVVSTLTHGERSLYRELRGQARSQGTQSPDTRKILLRMFSVDELNARLKEAGFFDKLIDRKFETGAIHPATALHLAATGLGAAGGAVSDPEHPVAGALAGAAMVASGGVVVRALLSRPSATEGIVNKKYFDDLAWEINNNPVIAKRIQDDMAKAAAQVTGRGARAGLATRTAAAEVKGAIPLKDPKTGEAFLYEMSTPPTDGKQSSWKEWHKAELGKLLSVRHSMDVPRMRVWDWSADHTLMDQINAVVRENVAQQIRQSGMTMEEAAAAVPDLNDTRPAVEAIRDWYEVVRQEIGNKMVLTLNDKEMGDLGRGYLNRVIQRPTWHIGEGDAYRVFYSRRDATKWAKAHPELGAPAKIQHWGASSVAGNLRIKSANQMRRFFDTEAELKAKGYRFKADADNVLVRMDHYS